MGDEDEIMIKCHLCEEMHPHPRGTKATLAGWVVFEGTKEFEGIKKKTVLIFCPTHTSDERWVVILKEFPPTGT